MYFYPELSGGGLGLIQKLAVRVDPIAIFIDDVIVCNTIIINLNERLKARIIIRPMFRVDIATVVAESEAVSTYSHNAVALESSDHVPRIIVSYGG